MLSLACQFFLDQRGQLATFFSSSISAAWNFTPKCFSSSTTMKMWFIESQPCDVVGRGAGGQHNRVVFQHLAKDLVQRVINLRLGHAVLM